MVALALPVMFGAVALATDMNNWLVQQQRLQLAVDAATHAAAMQLTNSVMTTVGSSSFQTLIADEINAATGGSLDATLTTPVITLAANKRSITVQLTGTANSYFAGAIGVSPPSIHATATGSLAAPAICVLALNPTASQSLTVGGTAGAGSVVGNNCAVMVNSSASQSIYVHNGTITATSISTTGTAYVDPSVGGNYVSPTPTNGVTAVADPYASTTLPSHGACTYTNQSFNGGGQSYSFASGTVFCGTTTIGGNASTASFAPGIYFFTGPTTFNNASISQATGVTFVVTGATASTAAPAISFLNNAAMTLSAPTSNANGGIPGMVFWQTCPTPNSGGTGALVSGQVQFNNGSPVYASGLFYAPCGQINLSNNAQLKVSGSNALTVVGSEIYAIQSAGITAASTSSTTTSTQVALTQ
jgi:hypothetical protein